MEGALCASAPWQQRHLFYLFASVPWESGVCVCVCVGGRTPELCSLSPAMSVPRLFPGANQQSWWQQKPWKDRSRCEPGLSYFMNTESAFSSGGGWLSGCVVARYLSYVGYAQHWNGGVVNKSCKVARWRYILGGEIQERTRKQEGSVGAMEMDPCYRPWKSFRSIFKWYFFFFFPIWVDYWTKMLIVG